MLEVKDISKQYITGDLVTKALDHVSVSFRDNEFVAILGPSGSGKTTLLNVIGGLDHYDSGDLIINNISTKKYKDKDWDSYRNHTIGFVFQSYNLIMHQSVLQNVELALTISNNNKDKKKLALAALDKVGLKDHANKKPNQLSGGQMQRVAIARALVNNPDIILADEPTGALDSKTSVQIMDLLKDVAKDKLVIMVTHNPDLAKEYASRIVSVKDGCIIDDTDPFDAKKAEVVEKKTPKVKLGWLTALNLSFNNLMTKKGRTILTAFAGAIGIIGIALILSLSNGVNEYIESMETKMLGSYPIELTQQSFNLSNFISVKETSDSINENKKNNKSDKVTSNNIVGDTINATDNMIVSNDLTKFKRYLEKNYDQVKDSLMAVEYEYNIEPQVYRKDDQSGLITVSPANLMKESNMSGYMNTIMESMQNEYGNGGVSATWQQLVSSTTLRNKQYTLMEGSWPTQYNEVALIVTKDNDISDYYLYLLGIEDYSEMEDIIKKANNGEDYKTDVTSYDYKDFIGKEYQVFAPAQLYKKTSDGIYVSKTDDSDFIESKLPDATTVKITCVLKATDDAEISSGIGYDASLVQQLIKVTSKTDVVKAQLENPTVNVLTGKKFEDTTTTTTNNDVSVTNNGISTMSSFNNNLNKTIKFLTTPGTNATFKIHGNDDYQYTGELPDDYTVSGVTYSFYGWQQIDSTQDDYGQIYSNSQIKAVYDANKASLSGIYAAYYTIPYTSLTDSYKVQMLQTMLSDATNQTIQGVLRTYISQIEANNSVDTGTLVKQYLASDEGKALLGQYMSSDAGQALLQQYIQAYISTMDMSSLASQYTTSVNKEDLIKQYMSNVDISQFIDSDTISKLMAEYSSDSPTTYTDVLDTLGYVTEDQPSSISLYPIDFDSKTVVEDFIADYNKQVKDDNDKVTYTDIIGTISSSITSIVNTISAVLIAFVAISLIVSSIMIAIITYISVLERTKEIGVLRALGTSKNGISKIFNAETFIEGLISGVAAILVTLLLSIPINIIVENITNVSNICSLPFNAAIVLILISVMLTLLAGFFPSRIAAKKDPVIALRSE